MKHFDIGSLIVIAVTFVLFALVLFFTGFAHTLLLEAGVFLVSVKLIMMVYKTSVTNEEIRAELSQTKDILKKKNGT
jgi:hypothetical protein